jgi:hypothetical protein
VDEWVLSDCAVALTRPKEQSFIYVRECQTCPFARTASHTNLPNGGGEITWQLRRVFMLGEQKVIVSADLLSWMQEGEHNSVVTDMLKQIPCRNGRAMQDNWQ